MTPSNFEKFLNIMSGNSITASMFSDDVNTVPIVEEEPHVTFEIRQLDEWLSIKFSDGNIPEQLIPDLVFYYLNGKIYKVPEMQHKYLSIVNEGLAKLKHMNLLCR